MGKKSKGGNLEAPQVSGRPGDNDEPQDYEIKDAADTLMRAEEIKGNKKLMPHVHKHLSKKFKSLKQLKQMAGEKAMEENDGDE